MRTKTAFTAMTLLLLLASSPVALGHDDLNYDTSGHRYPTPHVEAGVAGNYVGAFSADVSADDTLSMASPGLSMADLLSKMGCGCHEPSPPPREPTPEEVLLGILNGPRRAQMFCDLEVSGDGSGPQESDETWVDGNDYTPNAAPDGTWDDGGVGGACHMNHYDFSGYNTPGCLDDGARASALAPFAAPWIGASCDWKTTEGGTPALDILMTCVANSLMDGIDDQPAEALACLLGFGGCAFNPLSCVSAGVETCGSDGTVDAINYGPGNTRVPYPYGFDPTTFTGDGLACDLLAPSTATMQVYVFDAVQVDGAAVTPRTVSSGQIWQVA